MSQIGSRTALSARSSDARFNYMRSSLKDVAGRADRGRVAAVRTAYERDLKRIKVTLPYVSFIDPKNFHDWEKRAK